MAEVTFDMRAKCRLSPDWAHDEIVRLRARVKKLEANQQRAAAAERQVIDTARLVLLGWVGDSVDGGAAMRDALGRLRAAFEIMESSCRCGHSLDVHADNDHTGGACREAGCDCNEYAR